MSTKSALESLHRANRAVFTEVDGWALPERFTDPQMEYRAVRTATGLIDLSHRGLLQATGPDRVSFLHGLLSNDVRSLRPFEGQYAALLTQQGKIIADVRVLCSENSVYLDLWYNLKDRVSDHLNRYLVADDVEITDRSDAYGMVSVQGPRARLLLEKAFGPSALPERLLDHRMVELERVQICVVRSDHTGEGGFDLIAPRSSLLAVAEALDGFRDSVGGAWVGTQAQEMLRIESGIPRYGIDFTESNLLLETGLANAVSFTKGCYLGQEVIERIRSRGHVNKRLVGLLLSQPAPAGAAIYNGDREVGAVTSSAFSPALDRPVALAYLDKTAWDPGSVVAVAYGGDRSPATVAALPLVAGRAGASP